MENKFEVCVMCGEQTEVPIDLHIDFRNYYVEGMGQFCSKCYNKTDNEVMEKPIEYPIQFFTWVKEENTFYGHSHELWHPDYAYNFPNDKKQFYIVNQKTGGFRRFRFVKEVESTETWVEYLFESEDGIKCMVLVDHSPVSYYDDRDIPEVF